MNNLKLDNTGGLYFYQELLAYMFGTCRDAILAVCKALGDNIIIEGCVVTGAEISAGIVVTGGDILPFVGGVDAGGIGVREIVSKEMFNDGVSKDVYFTRTAIPDAAGIPIANFKRIQKLMDLGFAKSDSYQLNDSTTLATSKAVRDLWMTYSIVGVYKVNLPLYYAAGSVTINHGLNISGPYNVICNTQLVTPSPTTNSWVYKTDVGGVHDILPNSFKVWWAEDHGDTWQGNFIMFK
jgi:hypothetical protein